MTLKNDVITQQGILSNKGEFRIVCILSTLGMVSTSFNLTMLMCLEILHSCMLIQILL